VRPDIFNTDQGSQFTSVSFIGALLKAGVAISMNGKESSHYNVFVENLWQSVKYEAGLSEGLQHGLRGPRIVWFLLPLLQYPDFIRALTGRPRIRPTSTGCRRSRRTLLSRAASLRAHMPGSLYSDAFGQYGTAYLESSASSNYLNGKLVAIGIWGRSAWTSKQSTAMYNNQNTYWGF
jgi:hypothetical protein